MLNVSRQMILRVLSFTVAMFVITGCVATSTTQKTPVMTKREGVAPTVALLPFTHYKEPEITKFVTKNIAACLVEHNVFTFVAEEKVAAAVKESGADVNAMFGPSASELKKVAELLGADYTLWGSVGIRKSLKFTGWRKDVDIYAKLYDATGKKVDTWRSMTDFTWAKGEVELDAEQMAQSAANHTCAKIMERQY